MTTDHLFVAAAIGKLGELDGLQAELERRLREADAAGLPNTAAALRAVLSEVMQAGATLRQFVPQPRPGNDGAKYAAAFEAQVERRSRRAELAESVIDCERCGEAAPAGAAVSGPPVSERALRDDPLVGPSAP